MINTVILRYEIKKKQMLKKRVFSLLDTLLILKGHGHDFG